MKTHLMDLPLRWGNIQQAMQKAQISVCILQSATNLFYTQGRVVNGYAFIFATGEPLFFQRKPVLDANQHHTIGSRKIEEVPALLAARGLCLSGKIAVELDTLSVSEYARLQSALSLSETCNANQLMRQVRAIKTAYEIAQMRRSATLHTELYARIPALYKPGMTDYDLEVEVAYEARKQGSLGHFRIFGQSMEIHAGSVIGGDNALEASPYDFALGGAGMHPSMPVGANAMDLSSGQTVMVDIGGNYTGYMSDLSRVYSIGTLPNEQAQRAHTLSIEIHEALTQMAKPGVKASDLYVKAMQMVEQAGMKEYFMGYGQQAAFVGHGVGIEINEIPVLSARSRDVLAEGMTIALEPKFVIPGVGPVGIEDTYVVTADGLACLTTMPREIIVLS